MTSQSITQQCLELPALSCLQSSRALRGFTSDVNDSETSRHHSICLEHGFLFQGFSFVGLPQFCFSSVLCQKHVFCAPQRERSAQLLAVMYVRMIQQ